MSDDPINRIPMSESLRTLARKGVQRQIRKGVQIITEGEQGDTLYIVLQGQLRSFSANLDGDEITFGTYGPGEFVGEMGLDGGLRSANVQTLVPTRCSVVTRATLESHLQADPRFAFELLAKVIRLARTATTSLSQIALNDVYGRLKAVVERHLVATAEGTCVWEPMPSQAALASQLGCSAAMVSRVLKSLREGGYLALQGKRLELHRPLPPKW